MPAADFLKCMWVSYLHFMVQWFCLLSLRLFDRWMLYCDIDSVWHKLWLKNKCVSQWLIFHGTMILPYILNYLDEQSSFFGYWFSLTQRLAIWNIQYSSGFFFLSHPSHWDRLFYPLQSHSRPHSDITCNFMTWTVWSPSNPIEFPPKWVESQWAIKL